jgi:putative ABC transport system substrate-binding protein
MRRREFITLLGGTALAWPLAARAQQSAVPVIGVLDPRSRDTFLEGYRAFRQGLKEAGYVEHENVTIEYRWADNQMDRLPVLAADLVRRGVAVIVATGGHNSALAAKAATTTIPIVFVVSEDPAGLGLVHSLARPGGNLTGVNFFAGELAAKRLEFLRTMVPGIARVAVLVNPASTSEAASTVRDAQAAGHTIGLQIQVFTANTSREIDEAFATFVRERHDSLVTGPSPFFTARRVQLTHLATRHAIYGASIYRGRRPHELRSEPGRCISSDGRLCRSHPQRHQTYGYAGRAVEQIGAGDQRPGCQDARPYRATHTARDRRRGDRIGAPAASWCEGKPHVRICAGGAR